MIGDKIFSARIDSQSMEETRIDWRRNQFNVPRNLINNNQLLLLLSKNKITRNYTSNIFLIFFASIPALSLFMFYIPIAYSQIDSDQFVRDNTINENFGDTNVDGVVDALDEATATETITDDAFSVDEIQMDTNGDGVVDALDEATATGVEEATDTPADNDVSSENSAVMDEGGVSIAEICGDNIDNDGDGQMDNLDLEGCVLNSKIYDFKELTKLIHKISDKLNDLKDAVGASESISMKDIEFANAINEFSHKLYRQGLDSASHSETMSIPLKITLESLRLWIDNPGNKWGEWNLDPLGENDLDMSAPCYVTVPSS